MPRDMPTRNRRIGAAPRWLASLFLLGTVAGMGGCEGCVEQPLRSDGRTCGAEKECASGVCVAGLCTTKCSADTGCGDKVCVVGHCHPPGGDFDGDGLTNAREKQLKTHPAQADTDNDGIADGIEAGAVSSPDRNGDGIIDALQSDTADADGDCVVDAYDNKPLESIGATLPAVTVFCSEGVCADALANAKVVCRKDAPTYDRVVLGCLGCACDLGGGGQSFEETETTCDGLDNDCDGLTDELLDFDGTALGKTCVAKFGICAAPGPDGSSAAGKVECGTSGAAVCSVGVGGSASLAVKERCNERDDNCDGTIDEGFEDGDAAVGAACGPCGAVLHVCDDGSAANPPVVRCAPGGGSANCSGRPFADGFELARHGAPPPQATWTGAWSPSWQRLVIYGGEVAGIDGPTNPTTLWQLQLDSTTAAVWQTALAQPPGVRAGAALVWDPLGDRMLLVGGKVGTKPASEVWALAANSQWVQVSGKEKIAEAGYVPEAVPGMMAAATHGVVVGDNTTRFLVIFARGRPTPFATRLDGPAGDRLWQAVVVPKALTGHATLSGSAACSAPRSVDKRHAIAVMTGTIGIKPGVYKLTLSGGKLVAVAVKTTGPSSIRTGFGCAIDNNDTLHVIGGHEPGQLTAPAGGHIVGTFSGTPFAASLTWKSPTNPPSAVVRDGALIAWDDKGKRIVAGGGHSLVAQTTPTRRARNDVVAWVAGQTKTELLTQPTPPARIGHAALYSQTRGLCVAGGLRFELGDTAGVRANMMPTDDLWCLSGDGWEQLSNQLAPWAFGAAAIDDLSGKLVLAGGLQLAKTSPVQNLSKVWRGKLKFSQTGGTTPPVSSTVQVINLVNGAVSQAGKGPALAAMATAHDRAGRRMLTFAGFSNTAPTTEMWSLDLPTMKWRLVAENWSGDKSPMGARPLAQYGATMGFSDANKSLLIVPGVQFQHDASADKWSLTFQILNPAPGRTLVIDACRGDRATLMWFAKPESSATIVPATVPTFADLDTPAPKIPLYQPHFAQPAFAPMIYDSAGDRGVTILPPARNYAAKDATGTLCEGPQSAAWTSSTRPLQLVVGRCADSAKVFVSAPVLKKIPPAFILGAADFDEVGERGWVWGGLHADGTPVSDTWTLSQLCKAVVP
jgi:hypothetical protein